MRKPLRSLAIVASLCAITGTAQAGTLIPQESFASFALGGLAASIIPVLPGVEGQVSLTDNGTGGHDLVVDSTVFSTVNHSMGSSLGLGFAIITDIAITMKNRHGTFTSDYTYTNYVGSGFVGGPYLGGVAPLSGAVVIWVLGSPLTLVYMDLLGGPPGAMSYPTSMLGVPMTATGGPWVTGWVTITGVTTNVISVNGVTGAGVTIQSPTGALRRTLSTGGGFVSTNNGPPLEYHTVTISGSNNLMSASQSGTVTLVAPARINTSVALFGRIPMAATMTLRFAPEPGTMLLLVSGTVALLAIYRRRIQK